MVICMQKNKKPVAVLLVAALIFNCAYMGLNALKRQFYPRDYSEYVESIAICILLMQISPMR